MSVGLPVHDAGVSSVKLINCSVDPLTKKRKEREGRGKRRGGVLWEFRWMIEEEQLTLLTNCLGVRPVAVPPATARAR